MVDPSTTPNPLIARGESPPSTAAIRATVTERATAAVEEQAKRWQTLRPLLCCQYRSRGPVWVLYPIQRSRPSRALFQNLLLSQLRLHRPLHQRVQSAQGKRLTQNNHDMSNRPICKLSLIFIMSKVDQLLSATPHTTSLGPPPLKISLKSHKEAISHLKMIWSLRGVYRSLGLQWRNSR